MNRTQASKRNQLAKLIGEKRTSIEVSSYDDNRFECGHEEYLMLTDKEADEACEAYILDSVWAFNADFLACHLKDGIDSDVVVSIQENGKCESNNAAILSLIGDVDHFVQDAMKCDGRGHFLAQYDGEEREAGKFFAYRCN